MMTMTNLKDVFKNVKVPRPQISARSAYSTTPSQRQEYLSNIQKSRNKAIEYNKQINQQRVDYIKSQEAHNRKLAELKQAAERYSANIIRVKREKTALDNYQKKLAQYKQQKLAQEKLQSLNLNLITKADSKSYMKYTQDKPKPIVSKMSGSTNMSKAKTYKSPILQKIHNPLDKFM